MELRKACPPDLSLSNSIGRAGGRGHAVGAVGMIVVTFFWGFFSSSIDSSKFLNPIISIFSCCLVSSSLACGSARACSKATRRSLTEPRNVSGDALTSSLCGIVCRLPYLDLILSQAPISSPIPTYRPMILI